MQTTKEISVIFPWNAINYVAYGLHAKFYYRMRNGENRDTDVLLIKVRNWGLEINVMFDAFKLN